MTRLTLVDPAVYSDKALVMASGSIWPLGRTPSAGAGTWFQAITKDPST